MWTKILTMAGLLACACLSAHARDDAYPARSIELIIPVGAGGATDVTSRMIAKAMSKQLKTPIVPVNRTGAGGMVGVAYLAQQAPDGYRIGILLTSATELAPYVGKVPFQLDDLKFIASVASFRFGLIVAANSPLKTTADLVEASKKGEGSFFGASSISPGLGIVRLGKLTGAKFELINYKSGLETVTELIGGRVQSAISQPSDVIAHVKAGSLRLLASPGSARWPEFPEVPTLTEQGYDVKLQSEIALVAPAKTPAPIIEKLQKAAFAAMDDPEVKAQLARLGMDPIKRTGNDARNMVYANFKANGPEMKALNKDWVPESCFVDCKAN